jgi:leucyl-tRNA synthetase
MRRQLRRLGLAHDARRSVATIDLDFYRWTQWIFLQVYGSWYDTEQDKARPIAELEAELAAGTRSIAAGVARAADVAVGAASPAVGSSTRTGWPTCPTRR